MKIHTFAGRPILGLNSGSTCLIYSACKAALRALAAPRKKRAVALPLCLIFFFACGLAISSILPSMNSPAKKTSSGPDLSSSAGLSAHLFVPSGPAQQETNITQLCSACGDSDQNGASSEPSDRLIELTAGVTVPTGTNSNPCLLESSFDQSACVSTSTGQWTVSSITLTFNGTGSPVTGIELSGANIGTITSWSNSQSSDHAVDLNLGISSTATLVLFPLSTTALGIVQGQSYNYKISFDDGQSISGSVVADSA